MSDLTTLTGQLADMKQRMIDRLTAQGKTGYTMQDTMEDIVTAYEQLKALDYCTDTIVENGIYVAPNGKTGYNSFTVNVPNGGPTTHKKYQLLDRVYEDIAGDSIGTVCGFHYDANNIEYAIVCLDAVYRLEAAAVLSTTALIPNLPSYNTMTVFSAAETATFNCDKTMDWVNGNINRSSPAIEHCRQQTFTIIGETYVGQLPTLMELVNIFQWHPQINNIDPTLSANPNKSLGQTDKVHWTSTQDDYAKNWYITGSGAVLGANDWCKKTYEYFVCPILEIPNVVVSE